jgi:hypothetical protein
VGEGPGGSDGEGVGAASYLGSGEDGDVCTCSGWLGGIVGAGGVDAEAGTAVLTGAPHISQKLLPGSNWAPQWEHASPAGGSGTAACVGEAAGYPKAAPQLSQKDSSGVTRVPQTGQVAIPATTVGIC